MSLSSSILTDDEICCICMENKANLILPCTHNYCENCIKEWKVTSKTCPICRCISSDSDAFILAEKPDYFHLQDEISKSLFEITDSKKQDKPNESSSGEE